MLTQDLRNKMMDMIRKNPLAAIKELEKNPELLKLLLNNDNKLQETEEALKNERIKYVNMTNQMQAQLVEQAEKLRTTQGLLIGAGLLFLLAHLDQD